MKPTLLGLLLLLAACQSGPPTGAQKSDGFPSPERGLVWQAAQRAVLQEGFTIDRDMSSEENGKLITRWKLSLQPFSGQGWRDQVTVTIHDVPGRANYYTTDTQVVRQRNTNMTQPGNPVVADWTSGDRVASLESMINRRIELYFLPGGVSSDFRQRYGMPGQESPRITTEERETPTPR